MAEERDYYEILGVSKNVSDAELKMHSARWFVNTIRM